MTTSGRLHTKLEWTHNALAVPDCIDGVRLEAGTYCAEDRQNGVDMIKTTLRLGKATKGQSDGVYSLHVQSVLVSEQQEDAEIRHKCVNHCH